MRGVEFSTLLVVFSSIIILVIALLALSSSTLFKGRLLAQSAQAELVARPVISPVSPDSCSGEFCRYNLQLNGIGLKSKGAPFDALIVVTYKGQRILAPCPNRDAAQPSGACRITSDGIGFDLSPSFEGSVWLMPPTLNATEKSEYTGTSEANRNMLIDGQTISLGKFAITFIYFELPTILLKDRASYLIECADDSRVMVHKTDDVSQHTMCGGNIWIKTTDIDSNPNNACFDAVVSGGKNWTSYDTVNVALWNTTLLGCANISFAQAQPIALAQPIVLPEDAPLRCLKNMITNWDFSVPVAAWSTAAWTQPEC